MTKVLVAFRNSAKSPKEETIHKTSQKIHTTSVLQEKKKWPNFTYYECFEMYDPPPVILEDAVSKFYRSLVE